MLKYVDAKVTFSEVPDEITLCISISNCQMHCKGCHSAYLGNDIGARLDEGELDKLIADNDGITCVCIMGEGDDADAVCGLLSHMRDAHKDIRTAYYTGHDEMPHGMLPYLDYVKIGHYDCVLGGLTEKTTNQRFYKVTGDGLEDITWRFVKKI